MTDAVLITGSSRGIGLATARLFLARGYKVILNGRESSVLESALSGAENVYRFCHDVSKDDTEEKLRQFLEHHKLNVICVVNNAGGRLDGDTQPLDEKVLEATQSLNLLSAVRVNKAVLPGMLSSGSGCLIHISSSAAQTGKASPAYSISKGALETYVKNLAGFHDGSNVKICAVVPGVLDHDGSDWHRKRIENPERYQQMLASLPMGRFMTPDEIAQYVYDAFCDSDSSGKIIDATGGML